ncbi:acetate uptake transporter [Streptomyces sp. NPDC051322]|uniref:acetate uptake transporter n=1 Tax=Streptomyces sp. NPDC051322 TaxID=3154645 RepID=UPI00345091C0
MDNHVAAGSSTSHLGHLALGVTLLAFGIGTTGVINGVSAADSVSIATWIGGVALFVAGLFEFRGGNSFNGTAFAGLGAFWFTWAAGVGDKVSANGAGLFLLLWALLALSLMLGAGEGLLGQATYGLFFLSLVVLAVGRFADSGSLGKVGGWVAVVAGAAAWYAATAALAGWPRALPGRAAGRGVTAAGQ